MSNIIVVSPDRDLEIDYLAEFQKTKKVRQNLFYTTEGAETFYTYRGADLEQIRWQDEYDFFARQDFWTPAQKIAFISLGCGNAGAEKMLLHQAHAQGYQMAYFGVDSSRSMLRLADANLDTGKYPKSFVLADFSTTMFRKTLADETHEFDARIYAMLGGTFGNFDQQDIMAILKSLLIPGDYFYLDVVPRYASEDQDRQLRNRLSQLPNNLNLFFLKLLETLCIPETSGELFGLEIKEESLDAWRYAFFFEAKQEITFPCFTGEMTLRAGETLELLNVRAYNPTALKTYLETQGFTCVDEYEPDVGSLSHLWHRFLFVRS